MSWVYQRGGEIGADVSIGIGDDVGSRQQYGVEHERTLARFWLREPHLAEQLRIIFEPNAVDVLHGFCSSGVALRPEADRKFDGGGALGARR